MFLAVPPESLNNYEEITRPTGLGVVVVLYRGI